MLAIWRVHGIDELLREAWEHGRRPLGRERRDDLLVRGRRHRLVRAAARRRWTASASCAGSACPHYDGEEQRRPRYRELVDAGFPEGIAADDGVALHYVGTELSEIVTCRPGAAAYRVTRDGEERLARRKLA